MPAFSDFCDARMHAGCVGDDSEWCECACHDGSDDGWTRDSDYGPLS
jgi:hypothetical protein